MAGQWRIVEYLVRSNATQPHARLTGPSFELQIARAKAVPVEVRPITHHARPTAAIRAGRTGESDVGEAPGHQRPDAAQAKCKGWRQSAREGYEAVRPTLAKKPAVAS